jgi:hypothetical protein
MMATTRGWPAEAHESLLLCFIEEAVERSDNKKSLIQGITERMKQAGFSYSYDAIKYCPLLSCFLIFYFSLPSHLNCAQMKSPTARSSSY